MESGTPSLPGVPALTLISETSFSSPPPEWHSKALQLLVDGIRSLQNDHTSGAKELATRAVVLLANVSKVVGSGLLNQGEEGEPISERWWNVLRRAGWYISTYGRPSMGAAITAAVVKVLDRSELGLPMLDSDENRSCSDTEERLIRNGINSIELYLDRRRYNNTQSVVGVQLREFLRRTFCVHELPQKELKILTLSSSSTIRQALITMLELEHADEGERTRLMLYVKIMESRPLCEGVSLAKALVKCAEAGGYTHRLRIEVASDASMALLAREVDVVLLGADRISDSGDVSNKIGSFPVVLCAKKVSESAIVLAVSELEKVAKPSAMEEHAEEDNDIKELAGIWGKDSELPDAWEQVVRVRNVYFEWVPSKYIDHYICENGVLDAKSIKERSQHVLELEKQAFESLLMEPV